MESLLQEIDSLRTAKHDGAATPHKYVLLLAVVDLFDNEPDRANSVALDRSLEEAFRKRWHESMPQLSVGQIEYPFFHLQSHSFWLLSVRPGMQELFSQYMADQAAGRLRFTKGRLRETVEYACLSKDLYEMLQRQKSRDAIRRICEGHLREDSGTPALSDSKGRTPVALDTQTFALKQNWLSAAFRTIPDASDVFGKSCLDIGRKAFMAGKNQLAAIKNWLVCAEIISVARGSAELSELGLIMSAQDPKARHPVTWWLLHLHLAANAGAYPYSSFFSSFEVDGTWVAIEDVIGRLITMGSNEGGDRSAQTVKTYFDGIDSSFQPGEMLYGLGLVERRKILINDSLKPALRRTAIIPPDVLVLYATVLFHHKYFPTEATVGTSELLKVGLARSLGMKDKDLRDALSRILHHPDYGKFVEYRKQVNIDSISFLRKGEAALKSIRTHAYKAGQVAWS